MSSQRRSAFERGFGTLEVAIILSLMGALAFVLMTQPNENEQLLHEQQKSFLRTADEQLINFIGLNGRLPCPDSDGDGIENCTVSKGTLPYVTLGMKETGYTSGDVALRYGVYRKAVSGTAGSGATADASDADLAVVKNRYEPMGANGEIFNSEKYNTLDFCVALKNANSAAFSTSQTYVQESSSNRYGVAYVLAAPGNEDADGSNGLFDGLNGTTDAGFESASRPSNPANYDDHVLSRGFIELNRMMQCDVTIASLNLMANAVLVQNEVIDQAESLADDTEKGLILAAVGVALNAASAVLAGVDLANASTTLGVSSGLLSAAVASCVVLVGCALIPVYTAAVAAATTGVVLSGVALGASVAAVIAQGVATALYADAAIRASAASSSVGTVDWDANIASRQADLAKAQTDLIAAQAKQTAIGIELQNALSTYTNNKNSITSYATNNDDPDYTGTPTVVTLTENMFSAMDAVFSKRSTYLQRAAEYEDLQSQCEGCPEGDGTLNSEDIIVDGVTVNLPERQVFACPVSSTTGNYSVCDAAAQKLIEVDAAESDVAAAYSNANNIRIQAMAAAQNFEVYQGVDINNNKIFKPCFLVSGCNLPQLLDNTWPLSWAYDDADDKKTSDMNKHYYPAYILKQQEYDNAVEDTNSKLTLIATLNRSISAMQCSKDGKNYTEISPGVFECLDAPVTGGSTADSYAQGAEEILKQSDQQGASE